MANLFNLQHNLMMALMAVVGKDVFFADNTIGGKPVPELLVEYCQAMLNKGKVQILISNEMGSNVTEYWVYPNGDSIKSIRETFEYVDEYGYFEEGRHVYEFGEGLQIVNEYNI